MGQIKPLHKYIFTITWEKREGWGNHLDNVSRVDGKTIDEYPRDSFVWQNWGKIYQANQLRIRAYKELEELMDNEFYRFITGIGKLEDYKITVELKKRFAKDGNEYLFPKRIIKLNGKTKRQYPKDCFEYKNFENFFELHRIKYYNQIGKEWLKTTPSLSELLK
jgi:hypothetical protein